jgi:hypothetical protein
MVLALSYMHVIDRSHDHVPLLALLPVLIYVQQFQSMLTNFSYSIKRRKGTAVILTVRFF